jgi:ABC-type multidrug transport system ATPase subunit
VTPTAGEIAIAGHPAGSLPARRLTGTSLSQERSFYLRLTGRENLLFFAGVRGVARNPARAAVAALEDELELGSIAKRAVFTCSTGMVQQLALARALLGNPSLLLLDEPTRSLDDDAVGRLWAALDRRPQVALLMATHHADDAARCARELRLG